LRQCFSLLSSTTGDRFVQICGRDMERMRLRRS
jgi:hypothetical protein